MFKHHAPVHIPQSQAHTRADPDMLRPTTKHNLMRHPDCFLWKNVLWSTNRGTYCVSCPCLVQVPGVAGPVELVSAQSAAAAAAPAGGADGDDARAADTDSPDNAAAAEEVLPDLGLDEEGQPLSRRLKHQEGLATWAGAALPAARAASVPSPAEGGVVEFVE